MQIRRLFGIDLSGKLRLWKRRYNGDTRRFDHTAVWCYVTTWSNGTTTVTATAYCDDPAATGLDTQPVARFYSSPTLRSAAEAELHLLCEVSRAANKFPETTFYRKIDGHNHAFATSQWVPADAILALRRCRGCGFQTEEMFCSQCGEPIF